MLGFCPILYTLPHSVHTSTFQIMRAVMRVETNTSLPTSGEDGEQSVMGESHAVNSDLVRSVAVRDVDTMYVEAPGELIVLSCDTSSQTRGCVGCTKLKADIRMWDNKYLTLKAGTLKLDFRTKTRRNPIFFCHRTF